MLVPRGQMMSGGGGVGEVVDGFFIRRSASPIAVGGSRLQHSFSDNKENIPPLGFNYRRKRSPLPEWYPRTPLRDITALVNALDRRRLRATVQQPNHGSESTPPPAGVLLQESIVSDQTQDADNSSRVPHPPSLPPPPSGVLLQESIVSDQTQDADKSSRVPHPLSLPPPPSGVLPQQSIVSNQTQGVENPSHVPEPSPRQLAETMQVVSTECSTILPTNTTTNDSKQTEPGKLSVSIDEIEKVIMENLRSISNVPAKKTSARTRSLLSMR